jgi:L-alanine-DL-glutamate epimerase-like enolase superfamily enzyme
MPSPSFRIKSLQAIPLRVPFSDQVTGPRTQPQGWREFDMVLVRAETTDGVVGWGECFAYGCLRAVCAAAEEMVFPLVRDRDTSDIEALNRELQFQLHIWGRYGITIFAISGVDIALWDIAAKIGGQPLADFIGGPKRAEVPVYASLVRYAEPRLVQDIAALAIGDGYRHIKLHEVAYDPIAAGRRAIGPGVPLMTDVNCRWNLTQAEMTLQRLKDLDMYWVEEPIFPPEDFRVLKALQDRFEIPISAGENACTAVEFERLTQAVTYPRGDLSAAERHQGRWRHRIPQGRALRRHCRQDADAALAVFRTWLLGDVASREPVAGSVAVRVHVCEDRRLGRSEHSAAAERQARAAVACRARL